MPRNTEEWPETVGLKVQKFVALMFQYIIQMTAFLETECLPVPFWEIKFSVEFA